jgi:hypothetical protein
MSARTLLATAAILCVPAVAFAQTAPTITSTVTVGFSSASLDGIPGANIDLTTTTLDMQNDIAFTPNINVGLDFGMSMTDIDIAGVPFSVEADLLSFAFEPSYHFGNGAYIGVYYRSGDLDLSIVPLPITLGVDTSQMGLFAGYESGPLWVEAFYGTSDSSPSLPGVDITDYGISASYDVMPNLEVFGHLARTDIDLGGASIDLTAFAIGADYDFGNGLSLYGSYGMLDVGIPLPVSIDADQFSIGLSYDLTAAGSSIPALLSLEYTSSTVDLGPLASIDVDSIGLGFTIPLGHNGSLTPLNSSTQVARGQYRSAVSGTLASLR